MIDMTASTNSKPFRPLQLTTAYYLALISLGLILAVQGPSLPALAEHTGSRLDQISLIFVTGSLGYFLGSLFGGRAYDHIPGHRLMAASVLANAATTALIPIASSLWALLLVLFINGFFNGSLDAGCNTLLQWVHGKKVGPFMNGLHFSFGVGSFISPLLLARVILATGEIAWAYWLISLFCLPLVVWFWFLPNPPRGTRAEQKDGTSATFLPILLIMLAFFLYVGAELGFGNWIYTYAITLGLGTTITAAYLTSGFWGVFTLGRLLGVWISTRVRTQTILLIDLMGCLLSLGVILLGQDSVIILWTGSLGLGLFMASIFPSTMILAGERLHVTGATTGQFLFGAGVGGMFLPWLIGQVFVSNPAAMITILMVDLTFNLLILLYFMFLARPSKPIPSGT